ncbi:coiled-coil domain-containing protein 66-like isoform X2 [Sinocyclocheilus rhinocerous]|uniref:Coiled-coil domain-containing protein 66-like n=1 Tax=Sinocyclocheilus rhinocerous TaxID=307959 RepID=A0A673LGG0_9TELE|nr:PREDICTED: coiled-coil domain-containing protein 66-like isoform X2 [Sinocyclocheilus rhinocerous]
MMNLGDGLLFELDNGKPRLVLAKYGAESKSFNKKCSCRIPPRKTTHKIINPKQGPPQPDRAEQEKRSKNTPAVSSVGQNITQGPRMTNAKRRPESTSSEAVRVQSDSSRNDSCIVTRQSESVVCLTQEQFQQILSTISSSSAANAQPDPNTHTHTEPVASSEENCPGSTGTAEELILDDHNYRHRASQVKTDRQPLSDEQQSGLFSTFGERERERDKLEARKAQWRRELDEQMALKRQQKASLKDTKAHSESCEVRLKDLPDTDGPSTRAAVGAESSNRRAPAQTQREPPAAIRSGFIVGEAAPVEDLFSAQRQEQQRHWLQELDKQREEDKLRRQHDKEISSQAEDSERWAVHFDSLHQPSAVGPERGVPDTSSCLSPHGSVSGALSTAWAGSSAFGGDRLSRASVDTTQGNQQRSSYLRTMTALLDPAQIEERERRKLKQLEHQRAIEAQVEERRRQKEKEEAERRAQEQEEERRLERERQRLQQQYMKDSERQRHREEVQSRKTEELYLSTQRAQEEACKDKHIQRIRDLAKKGHDVSKLLHSLEADSVSHALSGEDVPAPSAMLQSQTQRMTPPSTTSPREDTAVQTEMSAPPVNETVRDADKQSPRAAGTCTAPPNTLKGKKSHQGEVKASEESHSREHMCAALKEVRADPYEPYARSAESSVTSPPVPAVKTRVHQPSQQCSHQMTEETGRLLVSDYVPNMRTDEVYHMDPLAPLSRPSTHEAQQRDTVVSGCRQVQHPPQSTERQQAILKGLSERRQGLLQRQRELETSLNPALQTQHRNYFSPFRPV